MAQIFYVNPGTGNDGTGTGRQSSPFKTIKKTLQQLQEGDRIELQPGHYNTSSGERFPLALPVGVTIIGNEVNQGKDIVITGGGLYSSPTQAGQQVTLLMASDTELRGVTVTNPKTRGTGVWIESTAPTIANCTFKKSKREGIFATGTANPKVFNNLFQENDGNGISMTRNSQGEIQGNTFINTGAGLSIDGDATPEVKNNTISQNRYGIVVSQNAKPILRNNVIENNNDDGISITGNGAPDLGTISDPGANIFQGNGNYDLANYTKANLTSRGNQLDPSKVRGSVTIEDNTNPGGGIDTGGGSPSPGSGTDTGGSSPSPGGGTTSPGSGTDTGGSSPSPGGDLGSPPKLVDIQGHWAEPFIQGLVDQQLISGFSDGTFRPDAKVTRAQYAALIVKSFNPTAKRAGKNFSDVFSNYWAFNVIAQAYQSKFLSGFNDGSFRPHNNLQRLQVLLSLVSGLSLVARGDYALNRYSDRLQIPDWAENAITTATLKRLVVSYPDRTRLNPLADVTRGEISAMIYQALVNQNRMNAINSPYIVIANPENAQNRFQDIQGHWAEPFIQGLLEKELISGFSDGTFKPDARITRAQYAALIVKAFNPIAKRDGKIFPDVSSTFWASSAIFQAYRSKFLSGFNDGTFKPNENLKRLQILLSLVSGLGLYASDPNALNTYDDQNNIPNWAREATVTATVKKLVVNYPQVRQLNSFQDATRGEVAAMVYQALVNQSKVSSINSPYIV